MNTITGKGMLGVAALLLGLTVAVSGEAQGPWGGGGGPCLQQGAGPAGMGQRGGGPGMGRHGRGGGMGFMAAGEQAVTARLEAVKATLGLTPEQLPAWEAYEKAVIAHAKVHDHVFQSRGALTPLDQQGMLAARSDTRTAMQETWLALQRSLTPEQGGKVAVAPGGCALSAGAERP